MRAGTEMDTGNLLFRRQFLLTPEPCPAFAHWRRAEVGPHHLYVHPDAHLTCVTQPEPELTIALVGNIFDPIRPDHTNEDILSSLAECSGSVEGLVDRLHGLTGHFVLLVRTTSNAWVFHDPCGLRTVYHARWGDQVVLGSQPNILREVVPIEPDGRLETYLNSDYARSNLEDWLPAGCSLYEGVGQLVPNHYLNLDSLEQVRFWPSRPLTSEPTASVVQSVAKQLQGAMLAASRRFQLTLPMTAGWDSRVLLAASRAIKDELTYHTLQYRNLTSASDDIRIPAKLLPTLGLEHQVIPCTEAAPPSYSAVYEQNSVPAHTEDGAPIHYGFAQSELRDSVWVAGSCAEVARCFYYRFGSYEPIDSAQQLLAIERGWDAIPFVRDQLEAWFQSAKPIASQTKIDLLDLFYWEHRMGGWGAQAFLESAISREIFTPFNHRGVLEALLSAPVRARTAPTYTLYKQLIRTMWPEVLSEPINPQPARMRWSDHARATLVRLGLYQRLRALRRVIQGRRRT